MAEIITNEDHNYLELYDINVFKLLITCNEVESTSFPIIKFISGKSSNFSEKQISIASMEIEAISYMIYDNRTNEYIIHIEKSQNQLLRKIILTENQQINESQQNGVLYCNLSSFYETFENISIIDKNFDIEIRDKYKETIKIIDFSKKRYKVNTYSR